MPDTVEVPATLRKGRYVLGAPLGEGGAARVVRALDTELRVERAIKLIAAGDEVRETLQRRLQAEARAMA
ncbi:MAG: serine/threonine protein kinase, partial [Myxococcota bacterium]